jgi:hypothetical protein
MATDIRLRIDNINTRLCRDTEIYAKMGGILSQKAGWEHDGSIWSCSDGLIGTICCKKLDDNYLVEAGCRVDVCLRYNRSNADLALLPFDIVEGVGKALDEVEAVMDEIDEEYLRRFYEAEGQTAAVR